MLMFRPWVRLADLALDHGLDVGGVVPLAGDEEVERLQELDRQVFAGKLAQKGDDRVSLSHFGEFCGMQFCIHNKSQILEIVEI